jgi:hypothetical protein
MYSTYIYLHPPLTSLSFEKVNITKYITTTTLIAYEGGGRRPVLHPASELRSPELPGIDWEYSGNIHTIIRHSRNPGASLPSPLPSHLSNLWALDSILHTPE